MLALDDLCRKAHKDIQEVMATENLIQAQIAAKRNRHSKGHSKEHSPNGWPNSQMKGKLNYDFLLELQLLVSWHTGIVYRVNYTIVH